MAQQPRMSLCPQTCAAKNAKGVFVCTVCKQYAPRVTTGYEDRTGTAVNEPFCDGVCMHYKLRGAVLEVRGAVDKSLHGDWLPTLQFSILRALRASEHMPVLHAC